MSKVCFCLSLFVVLTVTHQARALESEDWNFAYVRFDAYYGFDEHLYSESGDLAVHGELDGGRKIIPGLSIGIFISEYSAIEFSLHQRNFDFRRFTDSLSGGTLVFDSEFKSTEIGIGWRGFKPLPMRENLYIETSLRLTFLNTNFSVVGVSTLGEGSGMGFGAQIGLVNTIGIMGVSVGIQASGTINDQLLDYGDNSEGKYSYLGVGPYLSTSIFF